jgi:hypothetical protein
MTRREIEIGASVNFIEVDPESAAKFEVEIGQAAL